MNIKRIFGAFVIGGFWLITIGFAGQDAPAAKIDELMQSYYRSGQFHGSVLVADNGKAIYRKGFGLASIEWNMPNEPDTKFRIGSITKPFTALLILQLVEEGKIKLDGKLSEYLPEFRKDIGDKVTVHHLLSNTSGIRDYSSLPQFEAEISRSALPVDVFVKNYISSADLEFEPGAGSNYSNSNFYLLGAVIEKVTGKPYARVLKEKILEPSGMKNTGYADLSVVLAKRASGYMKFTPEIKAAPYQDISVAYAAGAMYSTVEDLYLWDQALYADKLLSDNYKQMMFKHVRGSYGYGWFVERLPVGNADERVPVLLHGGGAPGFSSVIVRMPERGRTIILLENVLPSRKQNEIVRAIMSILYNKSYQPPQK